MSDSDLREFEDAYTESELLEMGDHVMLRYYTFTLKASHRAFKGDRKCLMEAFTDILFAIDGRCEYYSLEGEGTSNLHLHAMLWCPYIVSKNSTKVYGWHTRFDIVKRKEEKDIDTVWSKYINKEKSTAEVIYLTYGNMFTTEV